MRSRLAAFVATVAAALLAPAAALAQEFQKVEGSARQEVPAGPFVALAYGFIWIALLVYVFFVARATSRVQGQIGELRGKLDQSEKMEGAPRR